MEQQARLTKILEAKDKLDTKIIRGTINMVMGLKIDDFMFPDRKMFEEYFGHILNLTQSLCKANSHRRKYLEQERKFLKKFKKQSRKNPNTADLGINPVELNTEIEGFLIHIKAALDSYAKSLNALFGIKLNGWHRVKKESGRGIVTALENNLPNNLKEKSKRLKEVIETNIGWITYLVFLRDSSPHHGGIKNITDVVYEQKYKKVIPQMICHSENQNEKVADFLDRQLSDIADFFNGIIALSLLVRSPFGGIVANDQSNWPSYNWVITEQQVQK